MLGHGTSRWVVLAIMLLFGIHCGLAGGARRGCLSEQIPDVVLRYVWLIRYGIAIAS